MKKRIDEHIVVSDDDLQQLGTARAKIIKDYLIENGPIEPERIFVMPTKISQDNVEVPALRVEITAR